MPITVNLEANPITGTFPLTVAFTGTITDYLDPALLQWLIDFGPGEGIQSQPPPAQDSFVVQHTYQNPGTYLVRLGANDGTNEAYDTVTITVVEEIPVEWWYYMIGGVAAVLLIGTAIIAYQEMQRPGGILGG